jgi:hypothetical protein
MTIWLLWLLIVCIVYATFKSNPGEASFKQYMMKDEPSTAAATASTPFGRWMKQHIFSRITGAKEVSFHRKNFFLFSTTTLKEAPHATFLGIFGMWFMISKVVPEDEIDIEMGLAESTRNMAHKYKAKQDSTLNETASV